jgi:NAD(P)-dependent dehydrogenase (short-subunit alcohol dehydrogenase family)
MEIRGNTFLVTGGASGLGAACVSRLSAAGANVLALDLNPTDARANVAAKSVRLLRADVTSEADAKRAVDEAVQSFGKLDGLVQCAGILGAARIVGREGPHELALFERVVSVNLVGTFNMMRLAAAAMAKNEPNAEGERGVIINTSSVAATDGQIGQAAYAASKGGVASLTLPAARELGAMGIRVVAIAPGVFDTAMMAGTSDDVRESLAGQVPFPKRMGRPEEFAQLVESVIQNPYLNGAVIRLDGGLRMSAR